MTKDIPLQTCLQCAKDSGTKIVCDDCASGFTKSQRDRMDHTFQLMVIELFDRSCVNCGHSAEPESGELCADHLQTKGSDPLSRYDLASAVCRCAKCHNDRHDANIPVVPDAKKLPKQTQVKQEKHKKPPVCKIQGCVILAMGKEWKKPEFCFKHQ